MSSAYFIYIRVREWINFLLKICNDLWNPHLVVCACVIYPGTSGNNHNTTRSFMDLMNGLEHLTATLARMMTNAFPTYLSTGILTWLAGRFQYRISLCLFVWFHAHGISFYKTVSCTFSCQQISCTWAYKCAQASKCTWQTNENSYTW